MYHRGRAVVKNLLQLAPHEPAGDDAPDDAERQLVLDAVVHLDAARGLAERVRVPPRLVRPALLHVGERLVLAPRLDARGPAEREAEDAQGVLDAVALAQP